MSLFNSQKKVTPEEYKKFQWALKKRGLNSTEIDMVDMLFQGHMEEKGNYKGIDKTELESAISWLRGNTEKHKMKEEDMIAIEEELSKYL